MSGLWTPDGERPAPTRGDPPTEEAAGRQLTPDEEALMADLAEAEAQLLRTPAADVVANHCYGLFQLAALHLGQQPPHLAEAQIAIDALGGIVDALGDRLGDGAETLREGLSQIRLAFVQIAAVAGEGPEGTPEPES